MVKLSVFDRLKTTKKKNTLEFIGVVNIHECYIELKNGDYLVFFRVLPKNISAMPAMKIKQLIDNFKIILSLTKYNLELISFSSYENYDDVLDFYRHLKEGYRDSNNNDIRISLLEQDISYLNEINATRSGSKDFFILLRLNIAQRKNMENSIRETEKLISEGGLSPIAVKGRELFDIIQIYLENFRA